MPEHRRFVWESFWRLSRDRDSDTVMVAAPMGGTMIRPLPKPITTLAIHDWCDRHDIDGEQLREFRRLIDDMDDAWREETAAIATLSQPAMTGEG